MKVKKQKLPADQALDHRLTGTLEELDKRSKVKVLKKEFELAMSTLPNYGPLLKELEGYSVELIKGPEISDLSEVNALYAEAMSYFSRVTAIELSAIDNLSRWQRVHNLLLDHIDEKESEHLVSDKVRELSNQKQQQAMVRTLLKKDYKRLRKVKAYLSEADAFKKSVDAKKKDLNLVLTTLGKQVKALSVEQSLMR